MSLLSTKNLSPRKLSFWTASILALANALLTLATHPKWYMPFVAFLLTFLLAYGIYYYTLQRFIYRKLKLIYKFIYQTKATRKEAFYNKEILPQKSIDEVHQDVQAWADQKKDEIELLRKNEQFRREFLLNLAHELRTPIFTIQDYVDTLLGGAVDDPEVSKKFLNNTAKSIDRLVRLADDLNHISKLESGTMPLLAETFVIQDLLRDVFEEFYLLAREKDMTLQLKRGTEGNLYVRADRAKIRQALANLIENAIKYSASAGIITAGCYEVDGQNVYVEISDNGPGIAAEHLPRIFERFYRADRSRSRDVGGTGLGLAIVKHIIEAHGHSVTVRSKPGVGSSFGFTLSQEKNY
jgi:two-component system phosphate regulon sensor histidine kinase PhoR